MDYLELADDLLRNITGSTLHDEKAADSTMAIAAAAIALAEATQVQAAILDAQMSKPQFVRIGDQAFNPEKIAKVAFLAEKEVALIGRELYMAFAGDDADTFLAWWNKNTNVVRLDVPEEAQ